MPADNYTEWRCQVCNAAAAKGFEDPASLRELLICTTDKSTRSIAETYFAQHQDNPELLQLLTNIALEAEGGGDAAWAALNTITTFPAALLKIHQTSLEQLAREEWGYLHVPARQAVAKIRMAD